MQHTKGPWVIDNWTSGACAWVRSVENNEPCHELACVDAGHLSIAENIANATVMAAAPEMLEALQDAIEFLSPQYGYDSYLADFLKRARSIVAKASGGVE